MSFHIRCGKIRAGGADIFYREAGREDAPVIVLFHGFPTASYMFSDLMPILAEKYHVIAPIIRASANRKWYRAINSRIHSIIWPLSWTISSQECT